MTTVMYINSSPRQGKSESAAIAEAVLQSALASDPALIVDRLDVFTDGLPLFGAEEAAAKMAVIAKSAPPDDSVAAWNAVVSTAERVRGADVLLFSVPMWNGGVPWALKLFIDTVTQPGLAFRFDPMEGYSGMLGGRRAVNVYTSQVWAPGRDARFGTDFHSTYFDSWLRFVGISQIDDIRLQPSFPGRPDLLEARQLALARARGIGESIGRDSSLPS